MAHSVSEEYLDVENIDIYLEALAERIKKAGIGAHKILVVGGAAMALKYQDGKGYRGNSGDELNYPGFDAYWKELYKEKFGEEFVFRSEA